MSIFSKRLKEARLRKGLTQEQLGLEAGLDAMSASTRMNRYELDKRAPDFALSEKLAAVLDVPLAYLFAEEDELAKLILSYREMSTLEKSKLIMHVNSEHSQDK